MGDELNSLTGEHIALMEEVRQERDHHKQHAADLGATLTAEQLLNAELVAALKWANEQIGWKGNGPKDYDHFYCEHCTAKPHLDHTKVQHTQECPTHRIRKAIARAEAEQ